MPRAAGTEVGQRTSSALCKPLSREETETDCGGLQCKPIGTDSYHRMIVCRTVSCDCFGWYRLGEETNSDNQLHPDQGTMECREAPRKVYNFPWNCSLVFPWLLDGKVGLGGNHN